MISTVVLLTVLGAAQPQEAKLVTAELVCTVKDALRWRAPAWSVEKCAEVAEAVNRTEHPEVTLAISVLESGLTEKAASKAVPLSRGGKHAGKKAKDVGLMGIRCVLGAVGRCVNLPGTSFRKLLDPAENIAVGAEIIAAKKKAHGRRWADRYNGDPDGSNRYGEKVLAVVSAFGGVLPKRPVGKRVRQIAQRIASVVRNTNIVFGRDIF